MYYKYISPTGIEFYYSDSIYVRIHIVAPPKSILSDFAEIKSEMGAYEKEEYKALKDRGALIEIAKHELTNAYCIANDIILKKL